MANLTLESEAMLTRINETYVFIESVYDTGNYIWSDPAGDGDNTIRQYRGLYYDFIKFVYGDKPQHMRSIGRIKIRSICGDKVKILPE